MGFIHHIGTFCLFAAAVLLLITTISAPVVNNLAILKVYLNPNVNGDVLNFGTFGYCSQSDGQSTRVDANQCTGKVIGYDIAKIMESTDSADYGSAAENTSDGLTRVMILHPICCGLAFIAFLFALGSGICGALLGALFAALAWALTLVVMAIDFVLFGIVKDKVNGDASNSSAYFSVGMWTILAAMILLFFGTLIIFFTCFANRRRARNTTHTKHADAGYAHGTTTTRRHFWQRRTKY